MIRVHWPTSWEREREMFYLTTHSTHFIYGYMASDHSDGEKGNPLPPHRLTARVLCTVTRSSLHPYETHHHIVTDPPPR